MTTGNLTVREEEEGVVTTSSQILVARVPTCSAQAAVPTRGLFICRRKSVAWSDKGTQWEAGLPELGPQTKQLSWREWRHKPAHGRVELLTLPNQKAWKAVQPTTLEQGARGFGMWIGLNQDNDLTDLEAGSAEPGKGLESIGPPTAEDSLQPTHAQGNCTIAHREPPAPPTAPAPHSTGTKHCTPHPQGKPWTLTSQRIPGTVTPDLGTKH